VVGNAVNGAEKPVEYPGMAHAVFGSPQVASLGKTEDELAGEEDVDDDEYETGTFAYDDTALGSALDDEGGFAKVLVGDDGEVLGCHVVGPEASTLIHEVSTAVAAGADAETVAETIHVHPRALGGRPGSVPRRLRRGADGVLSRSLLPLARDRTQ